MKRAFFASFIILFCVLLFTTSAVAPENSSEGFRGIPWGTLPPGKDSAEGSQWGLVKWRSQNSVNYYRRSEHISIGGVQIPFPVDYVFHDSVGFAFVIIRFNRRENYALIREACIENWGKPITARIKKNPKNSDDGITDLWTDKKVRISLNYNVDTPDEGYVSFAIEDYIEHEAKLLVKQFFN